MFPLEGSKQQSAFRRAAVPATPQKTAYARVARSKTILFQRPAPGLSPSAEYAATEELGRGKFGVVCKVMNAGHVFALKESINYVSDETCRTEIDVWRQLSHPNIVPLLQAWSENGHTYYLMPMCGMSLAAFNEVWNQAADEIPEPLLLLSMKECALALHYMHSHSFAHCDVKPTNMLVCDGHILLSDLSLARRFGEMLEFSDGRYAAPENALGMGDVSAAPWDIFSLGMSFLELGANTINMSSSNRVEPESLANIVGLRSRPALTFLLQGCIDRDPNRRPSAPDLLSFFASMEHSIINNGIDASASVSSSSSSMNIAPTAVPIAKELSFPRNPRMSSTTNLNNINNGSRPPSASLVFRAMSPSSRDTSRSTTPIFFDHSSVVGSGGATVGTMSAPLSVAVVPASSFPPPPASPSPSQHSAFNRFGGAKRFHAAPATTSATTPPITSTTTTAATTTNTATAMNAPASSTGVLQFSSPTSSRPSSRSATPSFFPTSPPLLSVSLPKVPSLNELSAGSPRAAGRASPMPMMMSSALPASSSALFFPTRQYPAQLQLQQQPPPPPSPPQQQQQQIPLQQSRPSSSSPHN